jgi:hypothetical protein
LKTTRLLYFRTLFSYLFTEIIYAIKKAYRKISLFYFLVELAGVDLLK